MQHLSPTALTGSMAHFLVKTLAKQQPIAVVWTVLAVVGLTLSSTVTCLAVFFPAPGRLGSSGFSFLAGVLSSFSVAADEVAAGGEGGV